MQEVIAHHASLCHYRLLEWTLRALLALESLKYILLYIAKVFGHLYITHTGAVGPWKPKPKSCWCTAVLIVKPAESAERSRSVCHGGFKCFHLQLIEEYQEEICQICFMQ